MPKVTVAALAFAVAGTGSAEGWRDLRVDGSSEEAFAQSMTEFKDAPSPEREYVFGEALKDIWMQSATAAEADQRDYTADEYYKLLDGRRYEEVVNYTDPTGDTAKTRYRIARKFEDRPSRSPAPNAAPWTPPRYLEEHEYPVGKTDLFGPSLQ